MTFAALDLFAESIRAFSIDPRKASIGKQPFSCFLSYWYLQRKSAAALEFFKIPLERALKKRWTRSFKGQKWGDLSYDVRSGSYPSSRSVGNPMWQMKPPNLARCGSIPRYLDLIVMIPVKRIHFHTRSHFFAWKVLKIDSWFLGVGLDPTPIPLLSNWTT